MLRNIIFVGLIVVVLIFVFQNTQVVEFKFLIWTLSISRALMLFGALAIGILAVIISVIISIIIAVLFGISIEVF